MDAISAPPTREFPGTMSPGNSTPAGSASTTPAARLSGVLLSQRTGAPQGGFPAFPTFRQVTSLMSWCSGDGCTHQGLCSAPSGQPRIFRAPVPRPWRLPAAASASHVIRSLQNVRAGSLGLRAPRAQSRRFVMPLFRAVRTKRSQPGITRVTFRSQPGDTVLPGASPPFDLKPPWRSPA